MSKPPKKSYNQKVDFSDEEIYDQIKDQIRQIKESNLKKVEEQTKIYDLYLARKQEKRKQKFINNKSDKMAFNVAALKQRDSSDDEQGQIHQKQLKFDNYIASQFNFEGVPSISNLGDHIRPLTLTRNKIMDLLNSRRFEELVKGCFVRYLIDSNTNSNNNTYIIAQIVGVTEGNKEYIVNNVKTKALLKLQQTSENVVTLSLQLISNQHPPGGLQIEKWLQTNRNKIPKEKQLKEKLEEHNKLLVQQLSSVQIDSNIWKRAKKVAEKIQEPKEDLNSLIDFVGEKLHNIQLRVQEVKIGRNVKGDAKELEKQCQEVKEVYQKLQQIRQVYRKTRQAEQKNRPKRDRREYTLNLAQEKRKDQINQKCKAKSIMLSTQEGYVKLKQILMENHMKYNFELDQEDMAY